ncbi:MAG: sugar ABC transporter permease [Elusimicrobia bacterium]|nr:sugar ABC transporter permease [Elusimicrobiota bacterium]
MSGADRRHAGHTAADAAVNWAFAVPALALMAVVNLVPIGTAFTGASGFARLSTDGRMFASLRNTTVFTLWAVGLETLLGLAFALLLTRPFRGRGLVRAAVLIPWALPTAIMAMAWQWIYNPEYGVLGDLLYKAHLVSSPHVAWLASPGSAMAACVLADVWKTTPFMALLFMSGLANIPEDLYEAAGIDGAGPVRRFFLITLPMLRPTLALAVIFRAVQSFGIFDLIWVLTGGGPGGSTQTIALYIYDNVFRYQDMGYACALTLVMALCLAVMSAAVLLVGREPEGA